MIREEKAKQFIVRPCGHICLNNEFKWEATSFKGTKEQPGCADCEGTSNTICDTCNKRRIYRKRKKRNSLETKTSIVQRWAERHGYKVTNV